MHAYMIIAHNQFELLEKLIRALDNENNDIFVHISAYVKEFDFKHFSSVVKHSRLIFTPERIGITWGDYTQPECEMLLLKTAAENEDKNNPYTYFHLLSGVDLPIKSNAYIQQFFEENAGKEFIHFTDYNSAKASEGRVKYYHFFRKRRNGISKLAAQSVLKVQKLLKVNRLKNTDLAVQKGCNWFSITRGFAHYVLEHLDEYKSLLKYSYCGDEVFIQTAVINSPFKDSIFMADSNNDHMACLRLIDWNRGNPYVWKKGDFDEIMASDCLFARKFDYVAEPEIVDMIIDAIRNQE